MRLLPSLSIDFLHDDIMFYELKAYQDLYRVTGIAIYPAPVLEVLLSAIFLGTIITTVALSQ